MAISGVLPEGSRLPTIRQLANDLGLAKGTVAKAYSLLESHGVVHSRGTQGTFVQAVTETALVDTKVDLAEAAQSYVAAARQLGVALATAHEELAKQWGNLS